MGYDDETLRALGLGCLLHDVGMLCLDRAVHDRPDVLSNLDFAEIAKHPLKTFDALGRNLTQFPMAARMVAYQIHERCDGSGYPRGRKREQIHALSRVAMLADVYVALVSPRPHRPALQPHHAVKHLLVGVRDGLFDELAARALLKTISLFPIGSYVRLNDQRAGQVVRAYGQPIDRPIILVRALDHPLQPPEFIDLAKTPELRVNGTLSSLEQPTKELQPVG